MAPGRSITESSNELTSDIDVATPLQMVRLLRAADGQLFSGYGGYAGMYDSETLITLARLAYIAGKILSNPRGCVVMSGAGTSGRLAMFTARAFNQKQTDPQAPQQFRYTMAGGSQALIQAQEGAEDDAVQSVRDLEEAAAGFDEVFYIGITCGMSAPYIAGQLEHMLNGRMKGHAVLMGFNPVEMARSTPIEGWNGTFLDTALRVREWEVAGKNASILNPIVGPEPITGSTRMKSGSATKILLEVLLEAAGAIEPEGFEESIGELQPMLVYTIKAILRQYENAVRLAYEYPETIAQLIELGGKTLNEGGHIYYLGATGEEAIEVGGCDDHCHESDDHEHQEPATLIVRSESGILGLVDASECPPTYGASFDDVRGYLDGGWKTLIPDGKTDLSHLGPYYQVNFEDFRKNRLSTLSSNDLVITLGDFADREKLLAESRSKGAATAAIYLAHDEDGELLPADVHVPITTELSAVGAEDREDGTTELLSGPIQLAYKLVLNALTTGAHILKGKVYGNRMVDLRISNNKLFYRTVGIISDLMGVDITAANTALLRAVYQTDKLTAEQTDAPVSNHIETAKAVDKVVPKALLLATGQFSYKAATDALVANPVVRHTIEAYVKTGQAAAK